MCLVMNKYSLQVSLPGGTGHLPLIQHPLTSRSLSNRRGMIYHLWISWDSSGLKTTALGQREEKQQQDGERQEWTMSVQRPHPGKDNPGEDSFRGEQVSSKGQSLGRAQLWQASSTQDHTVVRHNPWPLIKTNQDMGNKQSYWPDTIHSQIYISKATYHKAGWLNGH